MFQELENAEKKEPDSEEAIIVESSDTPQENPWDPIRKNIVEALQEVRVLHDFLAVLCHNPQQVQAAPGSNPLAGIPGMPPIQQQQQQQQAQSTNQTRYLTLSGINQSQTRQETMKAQAQASSSAAISLHARKKALQLRG